MVDGLGFVVTTASEGLGWSRGAPMGARAAWAANSAGVRSPRELWGLVWL